MAYLTEWGNSNGHTLLIKAQECNESHRMSWASLTPSLDNLQCNYKNILDVHLS